MSGLPPNVQRAALPVAVGALFALLGFLGGARLVLPIGVLLALTAGLAAMTSP